MRVLLWLAPVALLAEVHHHKGGATLPHDKYIRAVSEAASPLERVHIAAKDGTYIAAAVRKPKGQGPFPVLIHFHGAPGGRGMEKLVSWSLGTTGGPVWERFLQEGFVVVTADYRNHSGTPEAVEAAGSASYVDDGMAVLDWVRKQTYADSAKIALYGVSRGGGLVCYMARKTAVAAIILGAPAIPAPFIGLEGAMPRGAFTANVEKGKAFVEPIRTPILLLVGTKDPLERIDTAFHDVMTAAGKKVRLDIYENGYHDFVMGPQGHAGREEPLMDITMDALALSIEFVKEQFKR